MSDHIQTVVRSARAMLQMNLRLIKLPVLRHELSKTIGAKSARTRSSGSGGPTLAERVTAMRVDEDGVP